MRANIIEILELETAIVESYDVAADPRIVNGGYHFCPSRYCGELAMERYVIHCGPRSESKQYHVRPYKPRTYLQLIHIMFINDHENTFGIESMLSCSE